MACVHILNIANHYPLPFFGLIYVSEQPSFFWRLGHCRYNSKLQVKATIDLSTVYVQFQVLLSGDTID